MKEPVTTQVLMLSSFKPENNLQKKHKMRARLDILGSTLYCNFQTWLDS